MFLLRPFRLFAKALIVDATPHQMAFGLALGVLVGLVPKGNLLAIGLMVLLCSLRVNLAIGMMAAFVCSWADMLLDPITNKIGAFLLKHESLAPLWTQMYDSAVLPWITTSTSRRNAGIRWFSARASFPAMRKPFSA